MTRGFRECGLHWFPLATCILLPATFFISYGVAVGNGHVEPGFPYISDTGTYSPESCIFGQLLNISSVLAGICIYIRYRQVKEFLNSNNDNLIRRLNIACLFLGMAGALGISIVGNFQETNVLPVHLTGAVMAFGLSALYSFINTGLSFKICPLLNSKTICYIRLLLSIWIIICFITTFTAGSLAKSAFKGKNPRKWFPEDGGFTQHVISTAAEWAMSAGIMGVFATFVSDFRSVEMTGPTVILITMDEGGPILA